ncbi:aminoacyl-tRNA hydrolase [Patescibacteria group bacterium]|nr:aminoacyl-tRNA hydrolase [Patescibacteria group bacterium]
MTIIVGLGNPGKKYIYTRHNIGFQVVDEFAKENNFPEFRLSKKFNSLVSESILNNEKIILVKPQTFMNKSGEAVSALINFYKTKEIIIIHDDIDLPLGKIRISKNRGAAGHKGVESITKEIGTKNFTRFRIGISPKIGKSKNVEKYVLQKFDKEEEKIIKQVIKEAIKKA